ncbi:MAG: hypothetical protein ACI4MN_03905 [Candidatus Coproplasma sp.]
MAVDTPVLERRASELTRANNVPFAVPSRSEYEAEEAHNARIKDNYARLINPNNKIEDVFNQSAAAPVQESVQVAQPVQSQPYLVQNARADAAIFRADNPINKRFVADAVVVNEVCEEEESEDLRPTAATIQYRTVDKDEESEPETLHSESFSLTKKQKTVLIVLAAVVVALIALIVINATVLANINSDIAVLNTEIAEVNAQLQSSIANINDKLSNARMGLDTLRGATAGVNMGDALYGLVG